MKPLVSIIIPVYNGDNYLAEAVESALNQTYSNCEIMVINDGSNDDGKTEEIAKSYGDKIRYFHKDNGGVSTALNLGIKEMQGDYFSWLSHDDLYSPNKISSEMELLQQLGDVKTVAYCETMLVNTSLQNIKKFKVDKYISDKGLLTPETAMHMMFRKGTLSGCALLLPRTLFDEIGLFNEELRFNQDGEMWLRMFLAGYFLIGTGEVGVYSRVHDGQLTQRRQDLFRKDSVCITRRWMPRIAEMPRNKYDLLYDYALNQAKYGVMESVALCEESMLARGKAGISISQKVSLWAMKRFSKVRPYLRNIYYFARKACQKK